MTTKIIVKAEHNCGPYGKVLVGVLDNGSVTSRLISPNEEQEFTVYDARRVFAREANKQDVEDHTS